MDFKSKEKYWIDWKKDIESIERETVEDEEKERERRRVGGRNE